MEDCHSVTHNFEKKRPENYITSQSDFVNFGYVVSGKKTDLGSIKIIIICKIGTKSYVDWTQILAEK